MDFNFRRNVVSEQSFWDDFLLLQVVKGFLLHRLAAFIVHFRLYFPVGVVVVVAGGGGVVYLEQAPEDNVLLLARCRNECTYGLRLFIPEPSATCFIFQIFRLSTFHIVVNAPCN